MSSDITDLRRLPSRRRPNLPGRRFFGAQLRDEVHPSTFQSYVFNAPTVSNEPFWSPFDEAMLFVPSVRPSYQLQPLLPSSNSLPLLRHSVQSHTREEASNLSKDEQKQSLLRLRREIYKPKYMYTQTAKMISRVGQYYKGKPVASDKEYDRSNSGDNCAICLEEFEAREEVTVTPCSHMFHDECIVPWVKSNGQCPVCRSIFYERAQGSNVQYAGDMQSAPIRDGNNVFADELISIVRAMDGGGFEWDRY